MDKRKYSFLKRDLDMDRVYLMTEYVIGRLSLNEIAKMMREISYDMICYHNEELKGIIFNGKYTDKQKYQAGILQAQLRDTLDLFTQIIVNQREFEDDYFEQVIRHKK